MLMQDDFRPKRSAKPAPKLTQTFPQNTSTEQTAPFQTPDQVSEHEQAPSTAPIDMTPEPTVHKMPGHHWFNLPWPPNKTELWFIAVLTVVTIVGVVSFAAFHKSTATTTVVVSQPTKKPAAPKPTTIASTLSGLSVAPEVNQRPAVGVMIENSKDARPQSGLSQAGVVFEAIAEGGVTRFLALFQDQQPENVGPVRSARPYYVQWNQGFDAAYAHVGGSPQALTDIKTLGVKDMNQFYNSGAYHRVSSRPSPHNMYSSIVDLANLATKKGYKSTFTGFVRKTAAPAAQPTATSIDMNISSSLYNPHYAYDATTNTYLRSEGGSPHVDSNTAKQLAPNVVIAIAVPLGRGALDSSGAYYSDYNTIGSGSAIIFQDGVATPATWSKPSATAQISFTDSAGTALKLNPGQTWISAVTAISKASYK